MIGLQSGPKCVQSSVRETDSAMDIFAILFGLVVAAALIFCVAAIIIR
jgi:hypothetical protein